MAGEVNSNAKINYNNIVKKICKKIWYTKKYGYDLDKINIVNLI